MCSRFGLFARLDAIEDYYGAEFTLDYELRYNIAPEGPGIAVVQNETPDEINQLEWGLVPHLFDDTDVFPTLINARAENVAEKPGFQRSEPRRRAD